MGAMAPVILRKRLITPAVSTRNGKILLTLGTRNLKILNTPLGCHTPVPLLEDLGSVCDGVPQCRFNVDEKVVK